MIFRVLIVVLVMMMMMMMMMLMMMMMTTTRRRMFVFGAEVLFHCVFIPWRYASPLVLIRISSHIIIHVQKQAPWKQERSARERCPKVGHLTN